MVLCTLISSQFLIQLICSVCVCMYVCVSNFVAKPFYINDVSSLDT